MDQRGRGLAAGSVAMEHRGSPPPKEAAPAAFWGGHLPRSTDSAIARRIHGSLIHLCAPADICSC
eukprot:1967348-Pyramimonas_sp.AAC.1